MRSNAFPGPRLPILLTALAIWLGPAPARAQIDEIDRGRDIAEANCGRCHALGRTGESPHAKAPPFRTIGARYPVEQLAEALAEGIVTGHADMPEFTFEPEDIGALLAFLSDLSAGAGAPPVPKKP